MGNWVLDTSAINGETNVEDSGNEWNCIIRIVTLFEEARMAKVDPGDWRSD